ncbi:DUF6461 domain-containing protein [Streptomyces sp. NBC_01474]|uniref:DUF6461 domain-containing protein n=2 Tax=Streptomyces TaxID=1883 RepID=UPI002DDAF28C|nr:MULTISPECIES: DUF6461 domain-containing protein [unclassified Streptomyces]WSD94802.1 DUF6461 domain-containing protein [Streptomyces sp. NBC_01474]
MNDDGITWIARADLSWLGYCVTLARGLTPEELVTRLASDQEPASLGGDTAAELEAHLARQDREQGTSDSIAVRYGEVDGLAFAVAHGDNWPGRMGPGYTNGLSDDGADVFQLYWEQENPKLPPPLFTYYHDGQYMCGFDMFMHTWSQEIAGTRPDLIRSEVENAGIPTETDRNVAHLESLKIVESRFHLNLPKELVLYGELPAALIAGQS